MSSEANYVRVNVEGFDDGSGGPPVPPAAPLPQLLCTVRALLKKIGQTVLVGDRVKVCGVDWRAGNI